MSNHNISSKDVSSRLTVPKPQFINLSGDYVHGSDTVKLGHLGNGNISCIFSLLMVHQRENKSSTSGMVFL